QFNDKEGALLMSDRPVLVHLQNHFQAGAIPHIIRDIQPQIGQFFDVHVVVLQGVTNDADFLAELEGDGITFHILGCGRRNLILGAYRLRRILATLKPDLVHAHAGRASMLAPFCVPRYVPVVVTYHSVRTGYNFFTRNLRMVTDSFVSARTAVSNEAARSWGAFTAGRIDRIYNPVDYRDYEVPYGDVARVRTEFGATSQIPLVVSVGRLTRAKNQDTLLRAMAVAVGAGLGPFRLVIAGRGPEKSTLKQLSKDLGIGESVIFAGFRRDIPELLAAADVFAFPSRWEGLGIAALEAMAAGTAVVAADLDVIREYITDGETGLLTSPEDADKLSKKIQQLITDKDLRKNVAENGRKRVRDIFSAENIGSQYLKLYQALATTGAPPGKY